MDTKESTGFVIPVSYGSTEIIETGKWSAKKTRTRIMTPPCREACPAAADIALFVHLVARKQYREALQAVLIENPFPGVCGRVCYHPCEAACNRGSYDEPVSIQVLERFVSSLRAPGRLQPAPNADPRKVAVIGSGPAGLSCAYFLALLGHRPVVFEAKTEPGGVMRWGIPPFRLPKEVLKKEIGRILNLPVELKTGCRIGKDLPFSELDGFDAVFLSPGAELDALLSIEGQDLPGVWRGGEFLKAINSGMQVAAGPETLVIGGGNTAVDVARSARRLNSRVTVAYRRTREAMPAIRDEVIEAEEEGIRFEFLLQPASIRRTAEGRLAVVFQRMKPGAADASGRTQAVPAEGEYVTIETDSVISAVGERVDLSWIPDTHAGGGLVTPDPVSRVWAGGDAAPQLRTIVHAIASAKKAAISMDLSFRGNQDREALAKLSVGGEGGVSLAAYLRARESGTWPGMLQVVSAREINTLYFEKSARVKERKLEREKRLNSFLEVNLAPDAKKALLSAARCYSCGRCNGCLNCYYFCPEGVISVDVEQCVRTVDDAHCKGCGTCARACPRNAIEMKDLSS